MSNTIKKPTQREMFNSLLANPTLTNEQVEFIKGRIEALDKKNSTTERKPTPNQLANEAVKSEILANMEQGARYTVADILKDFPCCAGMKPQKVTPMVTQLWKADLLVRTEEKGRNYYSLPEVEG